MPPQVPKIPAVDRLSRDTTDLLVIAREVQRAGAGIDHSPSRSSIRLPILPSFAILGVAAKLEHRRKRRDEDGKTLWSIGRSYNVSPQTISRLAYAASRRP